MSKGKRLSCTIFTIVTFLIFLFLVKLSSEEIIHVKYLQKNLQNDIESVWREQSRRTSSEIRNHMLYDIKEGNLNINDQTQLKEWCKINIGGVLNGGPNGKPRIIDLKHETIIWEGNHEKNLAIKDIVIKSKQIKKIIKKYNFKHSSEITLSEIFRIEKEYPQIFEEIKNNDEIYKNISSLNTILCNLKNAEDTTENDRNTIYKDNVTEWIEWVVVPPNPLDIDKNSKSGVCNKIAIEIKTQKEDVFKPFKDEFKKLDLIRSIVKIKLSIELILFIIFNFLFIWTQLSNKHFKIINRKK